MLDWDDEELASILWDEAPETVVPYLEGNERSHSAATHKVFSKELSSYEHETKRASDKAGVHRCGNESNSACISDTEKSLSCLGAEPWKDPDLSTTVKRSHDSIGTSLVSSAGTTQNLPSSGNGAAQFDKDSESSQKHIEGHESGDFVDYCWGDIGSFDELDKILSNDDPIFGNVGLGGVDELWSASKDAGYNLDESFPSPVESLISLPESYENAHMQNKIRTEYTYHSNQPIFDHDNMRDCVPNDCSDMVVPTDGATNSKLLETRLDRTEKDATLSSPNSSCSTLNKLSNKVNKQKKMKHRKGSDHKMKGKLLLSPYGSHYLPENQLQQFGKQDATSMMHSYPFSEHTQLRQNTGHHQSNKLSVPCEKMYNQHIVPVLPQHLCGVGSFQQKLPASEVSHGSSRPKMTHTSLKPQFMTPQEKIDKLRRRHQMQAMLAIKKQQQELGHKASGLDIDCSISKKQFHDTQIETTDGIEKDIKQIPTIHPYFDPSCSSKKEIPNKVSKAVNELPVENSTLSLLQDIIAKLDSRVRLCIRDSLIRLATSAALRHYPSDTLSANNNARDEDYNLAKDEIGNRNRSAVMVDIETETNPIDRTVAHLLFHRPFDVIAKQSETPNLSVSTQPLPGFKTDSALDLPTECSKDSAELKQSFLPQTESENSLPATEQQLGSDSSYMDVAEKTPSHELAQRKSFMMSARKCDDV